ncbi:unnamed protein product [Timema podura]|uniref:PDZ domain-containing protein n=1 Tax=Timema podura TaxID=61482 RepID=A0ABN7NWM3_TIMPD|nr:unnamed protein product [Timema podura]
MSLVSSQLQTQQHYEAYQPPRNGCEFTERQCKNTLGDQDCGWCGLGHPLCCHAVNLLSSGLPTHRGNSLNSPAHHAKSLISSPAHHGSSPSVSPAHYGNSLSSSSVHCGNSPSFSPAHHGDSLSILSCPLTVVQAGSPADGELQRGDLIKKIGDYDARDLRHEDAQNLFKSAGNTISLAVKRSVEGQTFAPTYAPFQESVGGGAATTFSQEVFQNPSTSTLNKSASVVFPPPLPSSHPNLARPHSTTLLQTWANPEEEDSSLSNQVTVSKTCSVNGSI